MFETENVCCEFFNIWMFECLIVWMSDGLNVWNPLNVWNIWFFECLWGWMFKIIECLGFFMSKC